MNDVEARAYEAGRNGMLLSQFLNGIPDKDRKTALIHFEMGVVDQKAKEKESGRPR